MHKANGPSSNHRGGLEGDGSAGLSRVYPGTGEGYQPAQEHTHGPAREVGPEECKNNRITSGISHAAEGLPLDIRRQVQMGDFKVVPEKISYIQR